MKAADSGQRTVDRINGRKDLLKDPPAKIYKVLSK